MRMLLVLIALSPVRARAEERSNVLLLSVAAPAEENARVEAVMRERLQPLDVQLEVRRVPSIDVAELRRPPTRACFARAWIALFAAGSAKLYLEHGASDRLLVRDVPGDPNNPELVREELGHILQAAVEGLKAGERVGEPRQQALQLVAPEAPPVVVERERPKAPPAEPRPRSWLGLGVRYEARWLGDGPRFEDGPGAFVALTTRLGLEVSAYYRRPLRVEREPIGARLETLTLRALVTFELLRGLRLGAGGGGDFVHVTPTASAGQGLELVDAAFRELALARLQASYAQRVGRFLQLQVSAGADLDASGTRYVVQRRAGDVTLLRPAAVRPFLSLGAALP